MARLQRNDEVSTTEAVPVQPVPTMRADDYTDNLSREKYLLRAGFLHWVTVTGRGSDKLPKQEWDILLRTYEGREV